MQVENRNGDIQIFLPDKAAFHLDARTRDGEVQSDFEQFQVNNSGNETTATGTIGNGGPQLVVTNEHGTIELRKRAAVAMTPPSDESPKAPPSKTAPKAPRAPELRCHRTNPGDAYDAAVYGPAYFYLRSLRTTSAMPGDFVLNVLTGWTVVGWVIALVWALTDEPQYRPVYVAPYQAAGPARLCANCGKYSLPHACYCSTSAVPSARKCGHSCPRASQAGVEARDSTISLSNCSEPAPPLSGWRGILPVTSSLFLSPFLHESRPKLPLLWLVQPLVVPSDGNG